LQPTNISDSKFLSLYTFLSPHSWFSLILAHSPLCILLCTLCSKALNALVLIVHKCSLKQKEATQNKTFAQASSMGSRLTQHEITFMPSSWQKTNFDPLFKPFVLFLVLGLKLRPLHQTNMSCHVCSTLWISLICNNQILWTMLRNWMQCI
jgi:hypothetical protein